MLICLPAFSFVFFILFYRNKFSFWGWRAGYILSAVTLGFLAVIFVETATFFSSVNASTVTAFWIGVTFFSAGLLWWSNFNDLLKKCVPLKLDLFELVCVAGIVCILFANALVAFSFPPNNWDSMTYHLPRLMHWAMNAGVRFYPTAIERQLYYPPGAEYCLLHCFLLTGDDYWFNFLQWISLVGCVLCTSLIAEFLGASMRGQILTALFVSTVPMAVLESTSTQNDLVVSFWIVAFVSLAFMLQRKFSPIVFFAASAALGLGILTKGTILVVLPFVVFFCMILWKNGFKYIMVSVGIVLVLITGHYARSWSWQGRHTFISNGLSDLLVKRHDPAFITVNTISQLASELMVPVDGVNQTLEKLVQKTTVFLDVNVRDSTMFGRKFARPDFPVLVFDEDYASNPLHVMLIAAVLLLFWKLKPNKEVSLYCTGVVVSCVLFVLLVRWQPWINRLHLPLFVLFAPLVGVMLESAHGPAKWISGLLYATAFLVIISHQTRPLGKLIDPHQMPRAAYYFMKKPFDTLSYARAAKTILSSGCDDVGLLEGIDSWEYPLWALTGFGTAHFRGMERDKTQDPLPCMVLTVDLPSDKALVFGNRTFNLVMQQAPIQIFKRAQ